MTLKSSSHGRPLNELSPNVLSLLRSFDDVQRAPFESAQALLLALHHQAVKAARSHSIATYGSAASRKRHAEWKAAEAKFVASLAAVIPECVNSDNGEAGAS